MWPQTQVALYRFETIRLGFRTGFHLWTTGDRQQLPTEFDLRPMNTTEIFDLSNINIDWASK